jgi:hypothetical protein
MVGSLLVVLTNAATVLTLAHGRLKKKRLGERSDSGIRC